MRSPQPASAPPLPRPLPARSVGSGTGGRWRGGRSILAPAAALRASCWGGRAPLRRPPLLPPALMRWHRPSAGTGEGRWSRCRGSECSAAPSSVVPPRRAGQGGLDGQLAPTHAGCHLHARHPPDDLAEAHELDRAGLHTNGRGGQWAARSPLPCCCAAGCCGGSALPRPAPGLRYHRPGWAGFALRPTHLVAAGQHDVRVGSGPWGQLLCPFGSGGGAWLGGALCGARPRVGCCRLRVGEGHVPTPAHEDEAEQQGGQQARQL